MISQTDGEVCSVTTWTTGAELLEVAVNEDETRSAINYIALTGNVNTGDQVVINTTARALGLGTGGYDYVIANLTRPALLFIGPGHIIKGRYLPSQHAVLTLEER